MRKTICHYVYLLLLAILFLFPCFVFSQDKTDEQIDDSYYVAVVPMKMAILPGTQNYLEKSLEDAAKNKAALVVIVLDTPGGIITTTQEMVQSIIKSPVPVVTYVAPSGAMAASAGTFITLASHIAAMAPGTTIGAAHPVQSDGKNIDGDMRTKAENITVSLMKSISEQRNRNAEWAEKSIKESNSLTPKEAVENNVVDLIASDLDTLLKEIAGKKVMVNGKEVTLRDYSMLKRVTYETSFQDEVINSLANPNIIAILWFAATTGLALELYHPGSIFPGVVGIICLFLALGVSQIIPVSSAGILLIIVGGLLIGAEFFVTTGVLGIGGIVSMVFGAIYLIDETQAPGMGVSMQVIIPAVIIIGGLAMYVVYEVIKALRGREVTGSEGMIGMRGRMVSDFSEQGKAFLNGEYWNVVKADPQQEITKGDEIVVTRVLQGLLLEVRKYN